jgi:hypothetical protein
MIFFMSPPIKKYLPFITLHSFFIVQTGTEDTHNYNLYELWRRMCRIRIGSTYILKLFSDVSGVPKLNIWNIN